MDSHRVTEVEVSKRGRMKTVKQKMKKHLTHEVVSVVGIPGYKKIMLLPCRFSGLRRMVEVRKEL